MNADQERNLKYYLQILKRSSKKFAEESKKLRENLWEVEGAPKSFLEKFEIPYSDERVILVLNAALHGNVASNYALFSGANASPKNPMSFKFDQPSLIIQLHGKIKNQSAWNKMWGEIQRNLELLEGRGISNPLKKLEERSLSKGWENIDLLLEVYALKKRGESIARITEKMPRLKEMVGKKRNTVYTSKDVKRLINDVESLLLGL